MPETLVQIRYSLFVIWHIVHFLQDPASVVNLRRGRLVSGFGSDLVSHDKSKLFGQKTLSDNRLTDF